VVLPVLKDIKVSKVFKVSEDFRECLDQQ